MDRYSPVYQITIICNKTGEKKIISYKFGMVTKRGKKENIKNVHAKKKNKKKIVVLLTVCKQNKYFQEYTARSQKKKEPYGGNH